jgi:hypothetical protein
VRESEEHIAAVKASTYRNAFSLALWDGKTDAEADRIAEAAVRKAEQERSTL